MRQRNRAWAWPREGCDAYAVGLCLHLRTGWRTAGQAPTMAYTWRMLVQLFDEGSAVLIAEIEVEAVPRQGDVVLVRYRADQRGVPSREVSFDVERIEHHVDDLGKAPARASVSRIVVRGRVRL
jgi:hypothetical protein